MLLLLYTATFLLYPSKLVVWQCCTSQTRAFATDPYTFVLYITNIQGVLNGLQKVVKKIPL